MEERLIKGIQKNGIGKCRCSKILLFHNWAYPQLFLITCLLHIKMVFMVLLIKKKKTLRGIPMNKTWHIENAKMKATPSLAHSLVPTCHLSGKWWEPWLVEVEGWQGTAHISNMVPSGDKQHLRNSSPGVRVKSVAMELGQKIDSEEH